VCLLDFFVILLTWPFIVLYDLGNCAKIVYHLLRNVQSVLSAFVNVLSLVIHALEFQVAFRLGNAILTPIVSAYQGTTGISQERIQKIFPNWLNFRRIHKSPGKILLDSERPQLLLFHTYRLNKDLLDINTNYFLINLPNHNLKKEFVFII
jgi:hypothetical protein